MSYPKNLYQKIKNFEFECFKKKKNPSGEWLDDVLNNVQKAFWTLVHGFVCDEYTSRAASLTYYTVTSLVPFMALMLSMLPMKNFEVLANLMSHAFPLASDFAVHAFSYIENYGEKMDSKVSPWVSLVTLLVMIWSTYSLFYNVVHTLNATIWKVKDRNIKERLEFYGCSMFVIILSFCVFIPFLKTFEEYTVVLFYIIALVFSFLVYRFFPSNAIRKGDDSNTKEKENDLIAPKNKGAFYGAVIFVLMLMVSSAIAQFLSERILESYVRNYGKTFYIVFVMLAWIWTFYVIFLSCANLGKFVDYPKQNDTPPQEEEKSGMKKLISICSDFFRRKTKDTDDSKM